MENLRMSDAAHFEAKKHAYRQTQDGVVISFVVHPDDMSAALATAPLGSRYMVAFAEIGDDEKPKAIAPPPDAKEPKRQFSELSLPQQCGIRCQDAQFQRFMVNAYSRAQLDYTAENATELVRFVCGVKSRTELSANHEAANKWRKLESDYQSWLTSQQYAESIRR
jgi:hypothetical protein